MHFGRSLAHFWLTFGPRWLPFGSLLLTFGAFFFRRCRGSLPISRFPSPCFKWPVSLGCGGVALRLQWILQRFLCIWPIVWISIRYTSSNEFADLEAACHIAEKTNNQELTDELQQYAKGTAKFQSVNCDFLTTISRSELRATKNGRRR